MEPEACADYCLAQLERMFTTTVAADQVAAVIVEPVQGEGGFVVPPPGYLERKQAICRARGILLIADEVLTGYGRTGRFFASEHFGIQPDLVTVAKSIADGLPLTAVIGRADVMDAPGDNTIGGTFMGNPVACAAGLAVLDVFERENLVMRARAVGERLLAGLRELQSKHPLICDVRGLGAMCAIELVRDRGTREPADREMPLILQKGAT